jgi:hypothetical protein
VSVSYFELLFAAPEQKRAAIVGDAKVNIAVKAGVRDG